MGFSSSKSRSKSVQQSGPSPTQTKAANLLLESFVPGFSGQPGYISQQGQQPDLTGRAGGGGGYFTDGDPMRQVVGTSRDPGKEGYGYDLGQRETGDILGALGPFKSVTGSGLVRSQKPMTQGETDAVTRTLLPSMQDMQYKTAMEQMQAGRGTAQEKAVLDQSSAMAADPIGFAKKQQEEILQSVYEGKALTLPTLPEITDYVEKVYNKLPDALKGVIDDITTNGLQANIEASIENASTKLLAQAQATGDELMKQTISKFSAAGAGTSGAALAAASQITSDISVEFGANLVNFTQNALTQAQQDRQVALQALQTVVGTADQARAQDLQAAAINLETLNQTLQAQLNSYVQLTDKFLQQSQFYSQLLVTQFDRMSTTEVDNFRMVYEVLLGLATAGPASSYGMSKSSSSSFGLDFGGLLSGNLETIVGLGKPK